MTGDPQPFTACIPEAILSKRGEGQHSTKKKKLICRHIYLLAITCISKSHQSFIAFCLLYTPPGLSNEILYVLHTQGICVFYMGLRTDCYYFLVQHSPIGFVTDKKRVISVFSREVDDFWILDPWNMGTTGCAETSVRNYNYIQDNSCHSGISDLCGTVVGMVTPKGNMSTEGQTLQISVLPYRCSICPPLVTRQMSIL